jgi:hypothetical protein
MTFDSYVFNVNSENPPLLGVSLTASDNGVALMTTTATYNGKKINGLLFNDLITGTGTPTATLTANNGSNFWAKVDPVYNNSLMALYLEDRSTVLFTVAAVANQTTIQVITSSPTFDNRGPFERRKFVREG